MSGRKARSQITRVAKQAKTAKNDAKSAVKRESPVQFSISMICTLVAALFILTFNVQAFEIPTGSMEPTLLVGDHLLVDRSDKAHSSRLLPHHIIKQGDILVFLSPAQPELHLVKRVIGVPGDHLRLEDGVLSRKTQRVNEPSGLPDRTHTATTNNFARNNPHKARRHQ